MRERKLKSKIELFFYVKDADTKFSTVLVKQEMLNRVVHASFARPETLERHAKRLATILYHGEYKLGRVDQIYWTVADEKGKLKSASFMDAPSCHTS